MLRQEERRLTMEEHLVRTERSFLIKQLAEIIGGKNFVICVYCPLFSGHSHQFCEEFFFTGIFTNVSQLSAQCDACFQTFMHHMSYVI